MSTGEELLVSPSAGFCRKLQPSPGLASCLSQARGCLVLLAVENYTEVEGWERRGAEIARGMNLRTFQVSCGDAHFLGTGPWAEAAGAETFPFSASRSMNVRPRAPRAGLGRLAVLLPAVHAGSGDRSAALHCSAHLSIKRRVPGTVQSPREQGPEVS